MRKHFDLFLAFCLLVIVAVALLNPQAQGSNIQSGNVVTKRGSAVSASIGGGALLAGACASTTVTITGVVVTDVIDATPQTFPGDGTIWFAYRSAADTVTVEVCAIIAITPTASTYNILVMVP